MNYFLFNQGKNIFTIINIYNNMSILTNYKNKESILCMKYRVNLTMFLIC